MIDSPFPDSPGITFHGQHHQEQQQHRTARHGLCPENKLSVSHLISSLQRPSSSPYSSPEFRPLWLLCSLAFPSRSNNLLQLMCSQTLHNPSLTGPAFLPAWWGEKVLSRKTAMEGSEERGVGMNGGSVRMKRQERKREAAVVLAELSVCLHNAWTCCCERLGEGGQCKEGLSLAPLLDPHNISGDP